MSSESSDDLLVTGATRRLARFYGGAGLVLLAMSVVSLVWVIPAGLRVMATNSNNVADWLPSGFQETQDLTWFIKHFGSDEILVVSWPGCTLDDPRLPRLAEALLKRRGTTWPVDSPPLFREVLTGPQVIERLMDEPSNLSRQEATKRMTGWLVGPDGKTSCAVVLLTDVGFYNRHWPVDVIYQTAQNVCDIPPADLRFGGGTSDSVEIDRASSRNLLFMAGISCLISVLIAWWSIRNWILIWLVFADATYSLGLSLAIMDATGQKMNSMLIIVPALVYVLAVSSSIHLVNYYREAAHQTSHRFAAARAVVLGWSPCVLAALTTAVGLGSLTVSQLIPIRQFGIYAAVGTLAAIAVLLVLMPAALQLFSRWLVPSMSHKPAEVKTTSKRHHKRTATYLARFSIRFHQPIVAVGFLVLAIMAVGVTRLNSSFNVQSLFREDSYVLRNYQWLEDNLGPLIPVEIVVGFDSSSKLSWTDRLKLVEQLQQRIGELDHVGGTISAATFLPDPPRGTGARQAAYRATFRRRVPEYEQQLHDVGYLVYEKDNSALGVRDGTEDAATQSSTDPARVNKDDEDSRKEKGTQNDQAGQNDQSSQSKEVSQNDGVNQNRGKQLWRITARVEAMAHVDFGRFMQELRAAIDAAAAEMAPEDRRSITFRDCGGVPLVHSAQRQILRDLTYSFGSAFVVITLVVVLILRNLRGGLLAMLPNVFPALVVFGGMGWLGVNVDIGSMMTASVALGIAVDDTLHFLTWFQRSRAVGHGSVSAVAASFRRCGPAMIQTTAVCTLGLLVFIMSDFVPIARFAWLMAAALVAALLGDLVLLPALLVSRLGRVFSTPQAGQTAPTPSAS